MIEVELKVPVNDRKQLNDKLLKLGFVKGDRVKETIRESYLSMLKGGAFNEGKTYRACQLVDTRSMLQ